MPGGFPGGGGGMPGGFPGGMPGGMGGGMPGMGGMPNLPPEMMNKLMSDPDIMAAMMNPKVRRCRLNTSG